MDKDPITRIETFAPTNVVKTWEYITGKFLEKLADPYGAIARPINNPDLEAIYFNGVGSTGSFIQEDMASISGSGTSKRVRDAFRYLAQKWSASDQIYVFGFSRGAYAARSLCGFIEMVGLPRNEVIVQEEKLTALYDAYRKGIAKKPEGWVDVKIHFAGLWDTVGSLAFGRSFNSFHKINPNNVEYVAHALAIDEQRELFQPEYWTGNINKEVIEAWFLGVHCNIGGGYKDENLSNIALLWILKKAQDIGLDFTVPLSDTKSFDAERATIGSFRDSYKEFYRTHFPLICEAIIRLNAGKTPRNAITGQKVHKSVSEYFNCYADQMRPSTIGIDELDIEKWNL